MKRRLKGRLYVLLCVLLLLRLVVDGLPQEALVLQLGSLGTLGAALVLSAALAARSRRERVVLVALATLVVVAAATHDTDLLGRERFNPYALASLLVFVAVCCVALLRDVLRHEGRVDVSLIAAGIAVYLLLAVVCAIAFRWIETMQPGSFRGVAEGNLWPPYYSVVVITTLGFGDITPVGSMARALTACEAIIGQLYVAIFIGRLVGLYLRDMEIAGDA
ncbi:MAG: potassium channel family protein [Myxococcota bacterium]